MFDFRYHLVSLAAVFIALAVGILLGAAISGKLGDAENSLSKARFDALNDQLTQERERRGDLRVADLRPELTKSGGSGKRSTLPFDHQHVVGGASS